MVDYKVGQATTVKVKAMPPSTFRETLPEASGWSMTAEPDRSGSVELLLVELL